MTCALLWHIESQYGHGFDNISQSVFHCDGIGHTLPFSWQYCTRVVFHFCPILPARTSAVTSVHLGNIAFLQDNHYPNTILLCEFARDDFQHSSVLSGSRTTGVSVTRLKHGVRRTPILPCANKLPGGLYEVAISDELVFSVNNLTT